MRVLRLLQTLVTPSPTPINHTSCTWTTLFSYFSTDNTTNHLSTYIVHLYPTCVYLPHSLPFPTYLPHDDINNMIRILLPPTPLDTYPHHPRYIQPLPLPTLLSCVPLTHQAPPICTIPTLTNNPIVPVCRQKRKKRHMYLEKSVCCAVDQQDQNI